jgi:hypothetical protein
MTQTENDKRHMTVRVAINGSGRVGCFMRPAHDQHGDIEVVAVNDLAAAVLALVGTGPSALSWSELGVDVVPLLLTAPTWSVTAYSGTTSMFPISASDGEPL